jgi:hypothetical protein
MHTQTGVKERFLADLTNTASEMRKRPKQKLEGRVSVQQVFNFDF